MYLADHSTVDGERLRLERVGAQSLSAWYSKFGHLKTVRQNETLLGTLVKADEDGLSSAFGDGCVYLFVRGDFPATDMGVSALTEHADLSARSEEEDEMSSLLSARRIAYTPHRFHGYFIDGAGEVLEPGEVHIRYQASTLEAADAMAKWEFEDCEVFFGEEIVGRSAKIQRP